MTPSASRVPLVIFAVAIVTLFLLINRPAYRAFFYEDDLDNMANAQGIQLSDFGRTLADPRVTGGFNFRATGYFYYWVLVRTAGLRFTPYIAGIHLFHLINVLLIWMLARALGAEVVGACAGALFYAFQASAFDIYWKPMYVFDLLCATFALASLLSYVRGQVILALLFFWLSLRAKEVTIFFPVVLACYELLLGGRRWKRLIPFFAISLVTGLLAMRENRATDNYYTFRFTLSALGTTIRYYSEQMVLVPWTGLAVLAVPFLTRNRRVWFGVAAFVILLAPMLFLPGRLFAAYLYGPMIGLALSLSAVTRRVWLGIFFLLWIPWNYAAFRTERSRALDLSYERRHWYAPVAEFFRTHPDTDTVVWDGAPENVPDHFIGGAVRMLRDGRPIEVAWINRVNNEMQAPKLVVLVWDQPRLHLHVLPRQPDVAYIHTDEDAPPWQLTSGWAANQGYFRWIQPHATARLYRPPGARRFQIEILVRGFDATHPGRLEVTLDGAALGSLTLTQPGLTTFQFPLPAGKEGPVTVGLTVTPPYHDPGGAGDLGQPIAALGFVE